MYYFWYLLKLVIVVLIGKVISKMKSRDSHFFQTTVVLNLRANVYG